MSFSHALWIGDTLAIFQSSGKIPVARHVLNNVINDKAITDATSFNSLADISRLDFDV